MPANLNALIRYKTIDRLLGTGRKYALSELVEHCSEYIGETRGVYKIISKRTIQEDIRILRSSILGFNAPIKNSFGKYYYTRPDYSIFNKSISSINILKRVYTFLLLVRDDMENDKLDALLVEIGELLYDEKYLVTESEEDSLKDLSIKDSPMRAFKVKEKRQGPPVSKKIAALKTSSLKTPIRKRQIPAFGWNKVLEYIK